MPQLDKVTFLSQFFWLSFFFLGFYLLLAKTFLPKMSRVLKVRSRYLGGVTQSAWQEENKKVSLSQSELSADGFKNFRSFFTENFQNTGEWAQASLSNMNKKELLDTNKKYMATLGHQSIVTNKTLNNLVTLLPPSKVDGEMYEKMYIATLFSSI
uniref:H(+)-transporting two-sector ATPase n=1 Tax=Cymbomonas tetramitiformis TaxID=36881 RepID=A0A1S5R1Y8_9CHLO|nr:ATP synthase F0 subunit 8 [Cymbomonas tetramitiformis]ANA57086.1 ATP synthase F0 subunit 8 [Cymbomonas tetramitiformis]